MLDAAFCRISGLRFIESTVETLAFKGAALAKAQVVYASRIGALIIMRVLWDALYRNHGTKA